MISEGTMCILSDTWYRGVPQSPPAEIVKLQAALLCDRVEWVFQAKTAYFCMSTKCSRILATDHQIWYTIPFWLV